MEQLGIETDTEAGYEITGFDGNRSISRVVSVHLIFLRKTFRGQYLLIEQESGILGRDILNHIRLFLDGPQQQWEER